MLSCFGVIAIACIAPLASLPILIYWVCIFLTRSSATCEIVSNSVLNNLPNVLVDPAAYLKYCLMLNLFFSKEFVNASVDVLIVRISAENLPVALIALSRSVCNVRWASAA